MPKISELPESQGLTGAEIIAIVQDGETRNLSLVEIIGERNILYFRWTTSNWSNHFINYNYVLLDVDGNAVEGLNEDEECYFINWKDMSFQLKGQAYYAKSQLTTLVWGYEIEFAELVITPEEQDIIFDNVETSRDLEIEDGKWTLSVNDAEFSPGWSIQVFNDGGLAATLESGNTECVLTAKYGKKRSVKLIQNAPFPATVHISHGVRYLINGEVPRIEFCGDQFTVSTETAPSACEISIYATLYGQDGNTIVFNTELWLDVTNEAVIVEE